MEKGRRQWQRNVAFVGFSVSFLLLLLVDGGLIVSNSLFAFYPLLLVMFFFRRPSQPLLAAVCAACFILLGASLITTKCDFLVSLQETEKITFLFLSIFLVISFKEKGFFFRLIFFSATGVALIGLASYCGLLPISEYVSSQSWELLVRLQSTLRYANTTCVFIGCGYFAFLSNYEKFRRYKLANCAGILLMSAVLLTVSKAGIVIFLITCMVYCILEKNKQKVFASQLVISGLIAVCMLLCEKISAFLCIPILVAGAAIGCRFRFCGPLRRYRLYCIIFLSVSVICGLLLFFFTSVFSTFGERLEYYRDALALIAKYPLLGCGAGGWRDVGYSVQQSVYYTKFVHNGWLQFAAENGIPFALLVLFLLLMAMRKAVKNKQWEIAFPLAFLGVHAFFDIDLSFTVILMLTGIYIGAALYAPSEDPKKKPAWCHILAYVMSALAIVAAIAMSMFSSYNDQFSKEYTQKNYIAAQSWAERMDAILPRSSKQKMYLASCSEKNGAPTEKVKEYLQDAVRCAPYDLEVYRAYMGYTISDSNAEEMCRYYISIRPRLTTTYDELSDFLVQAKDCGLISAETYEDMLLVRKQLRVQNVERYYRDVEQDNGNTVLQ